MEFTAAKIAEILGGIVEGNPEISVNMLSKIEEGTPKSITFLANPNYTPYIYTTNASVVIVNKTFVAEKPLKPGCTLIRVEDAYKAFATLLEAYHSFKNNKKGIEPQTFISNTAKIGSDFYLGSFSYIGEHVSIGNNVKIYPQCYIGDNVIIKDNTTIHAGVKIYADTIIGQHCILHAGVVIGSDGFGFAPNQENNYIKVPQIGNVILEDHIEIGANTTIDRATLGSTVIKKGVKLDNLIQIAHNVEIGENTVIAAQTGVAGSTKIGKDCMIGGQVGIVGHIQIANKVKIAAQSGVASSINKEGEVVQGSPAFPIGDFKRSYVSFKNLPELTNKINQLENNLIELKKLAKSLQDE